MRADLTNIIAGIFAKARDLKKNKLINTTYTRDGMIYIKDTFNHVHTITRQNELDIFVASLNIPNPMDTVPDEGPDAGVASPSATSLPTTTQHTTTARSGKVRRH